MLKRPGVPLLCNQSETALTDKYLFAAPLLDVHRVVGRAWRRLQVQWVVACAVQHARALRLLGTAGLCQFAPATVDARWCGPASSVRGRSKSVDSGEVYMLEMPYLFSVTGVVNVS